MNYYADDRNGVSWRLDTFTHYAHKVGSKTVLAYRNDDDTDPVEFESEVWHGPSTPDWQLVAAPAGLWWLEVRLHDDDAVVFSRGLVAAWAFNPDWGIVPLGIGETEPAGCNKYRAVIVPDGRVEFDGRVFLDEASFIAAREAELREQRDRRKGAGSRVART